MPIRKFTNGRFSLKRFTAPGIGVTTGGFVPAPIGPNVVSQIFTETTSWIVPEGITSVEYLVLM